MPRLPRLFLLTLLFLPHSVLAEEILPTPPPSSASVTPPSPPASIRILYEGDTGGISSGVADLADSRLLYRAIEEAAGQVLSDSSNLAGFYNDFRYLWNDGSPTLAGGLEFFASPPFTPTSPPLSLPVWSGPYAVMWATEGGKNGQAPQVPSLTDSPLARVADHDGIPRLPASLTLWTNATGKKAWVLDLAPDRGQPSLSASPEDWEVLERIELFAKTPIGETTLFLLAKRVGEGTRRKARVEARLKEEIPTLYVSAGGSLEGRSFLPGQALSLHRPLTWEALQESKLRLLVPGRAELLAGIPGLTAEARGAGVELVSCNLVDSQTGQPLFTPVALEKLGGKRVAVVGITDPGIWKLLDPESRSQVKLEDPAKALPVCLAGVEADLTLLLTAMPGKDLASLTSHLSGIDAVVGDFSAGIRQAALSTATLLPQGQELGEDRGHRPALVARSSGLVLGSLTATFAPDGGLETLENSLEPLLQDSAGDEAWKRRVMAIRQKVYRDAEGILVPDLNGILPPPEPGQSTRRMDDKRWMNLVSGMIRHRTGADVVLVPPLPWPFDFTGPTRELYALASLAGIDRLQSVTVTGDVLRRLLLLSWSDKGAPDRASEFAGDTRILGDRIEPMVAGAWIGDKDPGNWKVRGGSIVDANTYRVVLTENLASRPEFASILGGQKVLKRFVAGGNGFLLPVPRGGQELSVREVVLEGLLEMRNQDPAFSPLYQRRLVRLLTRSGTTLEPVFVARLESLALHLAWNHLEVADPEAYSAVTEPRATTAGSLDVGFTAKGSLTLEAPTVNWVTSMNGVYTLSRVGGTEATETQDDLQFSTELQLKPPDVKVGKGLSLWPVANLTWDTVWDLLGEDDPRQRTLREGGGLAISKLWTPIPLIKLGAFAEQDFSIPGDPGLQGGLSATLTHEWPVSPVKWHTDAVFNYWFPVASRDGEDDLAYSLNVKTSLSVPVWGGFSLSTYLDAFLFQRKGLDGAEAPSPAISTILGIDLGFSGVARKRL